MFKRSWFIIAVIIVLYSSIMGCGDNKNSNDGGRPAIIAEPIDVDPAGGINNESRLGITLSAPAGTFSTDKNIKIIITEMGGVGSGYLNLASNIYTITAYTEENKEITETDKPITVTIINSANPAEESYIGILEKGLWNFTCVYPPTDSSVRADFENNSQIDIYKLGVSVAVFVRNPQAAKTAVITEAEAASSTINLKTANNKYAEDLPIELTLKGNPEATDMTLSDYYIRIRYQNKNKEDAKFTVNGGKAQITTDQENLPALSGLYSHEITITEINPEILGRYMIASFSLGLKGKKLSDFSDKLVITVSNTPGSELFRTVPFTYSQDISIGKP